MSKIKVHAGDFHSGGGTFSSAGLIMSTAPGYLNRETIPLTELELVEVATEESVKKAVGTVGWGVAGAVVLGPVGLLAGLLLGGKKKEVTFVAKFNDGRKMLATTDSKTFTKLQAAIFNQPFDKTQV